MQTIDNSNLLGYNKNFDYRSWNPRLKYVWDPAAKTITVTDESVTPDNATYKTVNLEIHDKYGKSVRGHMSSGGSGYLPAPANPPAVTIAAPTAGGTQAVATSIVSADGHVTGFNITNQGTLYATAPAITLAAAPGGGTTATATGYVVNGKLTKILLNTASSGVIDISTLSVNKGLNISATAVISNGWSATGSAIQITNAAAGGYLQDWNKGESPASADAIQNRASFGV